MKRGSILDRNDTIIIHSIGEVGQIIRQNNYPPLTNTLGFIDNSYGSSGLEASLEEYLGGEKGYPAFDLWFNYLLYDQPLPGRDVRLTIDLKLQTAVDDLLEPFVGSAVVMNAENGEILAIASHPYINSNELKESWDSMESGRQFTLYQQGSARRLPYEQPGHPISALQSQPAGSAGIRPHTQGGK